MLVIIQESYNAFCLTKSKESDLLFKYIVGQNMEDNEISSAEVIHRNEKQADVKNEDMIRKQQYLKIHVHSVYSQNDTKLEEFANLFIDQLHKRKKVQVGQLGENVLEYVNLQELTEVVLMFQEKQKIGSVPADLPIKINQIEKIDEIDEPLPFKPQRILYINGAWDYKLIGQEHCRTIKPYFQLNQDSNPKVKLNKHFTKKNGGFFGIGGRLELWTTVQTNFTKDSVERKIQDFIFLQQILKKCFPHTFIPPLEITKEQLNQVNQLSMQRSLLQRCQFFITAVCLSKHLLQNFFTFRFFKELKYDSYADHKKQNDIRVINELRLVQDTRKKIHIQISNQNQMLKKDYRKMSGQLQKFWKNNSRLNGKIASLLTEISRCLEEEKKEFDFIIKAITQHDLNNLSKSYQGMLNVMLGCQDMVLIYSRNFNQYQSAFQKFNTRLSIDSQKNWHAFSKYSDEFKQKDREYKKLRKAFLQKDMQKSQTTQLKQSLQKMTEATQSRTIYTPNQSIILEPEFIEEQEALWIAKYSKWQAYMNSEYINSFQGLLDGNVMTLSQILRQNALQIPQFNKQIQRQSEAVIKNMNCIL